MRGEWRANELTLNGLVLELGLDQRGRMTWAERSGGFNLGALTVDKFHVTGAVMLNDAASRTSFRLDDIVFAGEVRALAGTVRGEGVLKADGVRYPFRVATGRTADGVGQRLRLNVESRRAAARRRSRRRPAFRRCAAAVRRLAFDRKAGSRRSRAHRPLWPMRRGGWPAS